MSLPVLDIPPTAAASIVGVLVGSAITSVSQWLSTRAVVKREREKEVADRRSLRAAHLREAFFPIVGVVSKVDRDAYYLRHPGVPNAGPYLTSVAKCAELLASFAPKLELETGIDNVREKYTALHLACEEFLILHRWHETEGGKTEGELVQEIAGQALDVYETMRSVLSEIEGPSPITSPPAASSLTSKDRRAIETRAEPPP